MSFSFNGVTEVAKVSISNSKNDTSNRRLDFRVSVAKPNDRQDGGCN